MARNPSPKKKAAATPSAGAPKYGDALKAIAGTGVNMQEIGRLNKAGAISIDPEKLEALKKQLGEAAWSKVRFVALNAPFKRRSAIPTT